MKILTVSDETCPALYDYYVPGRLAEYDLIISCGDLNPKYLSFLVTMARCPLIYVHGNHDGRYEQTPPEGCDSIDDKIVEFNGLRILGLGGCRQYRPGPHQYTEAQMERRIIKLRKRIKKLGGVDIVVTHAAPAGLGDAEDAAHRGFESLKDFLDDYSPAYLIHGHVHMSYDHQILREISYKDTTIINACERYAFEVPNRPYELKNHGQIIDKTKGNILELLQNPTERRKAMFKGFTPETIDFLWGIRLNNEREWFLQHKQQYVDTLYEPMKALGKQLFEPFSDTPGNILKVSRIYRDARMHHATPYKESLWTCIRQDADYWAENPCLFFEINPEGVDYGFSFWQPKTAAMNQFRQDITAYPDDFLNLLKKTEEAVGMPLTAECYKRPKPTDNPDLEPYFAWKGHLRCIRHLDPSPAIFGPELAEEVGDFFGKLRPVYEYFNRFRG